MAEQKNDKQEKTENHEPKEEDMRKLIILTDGIKFSVSQESTVSPLEAEMICRKFLGI